MSKSSLSRNITRYLLLLCSTVCRATIKEIDVEILKTHPGQVINIGGHRMDASGNTIYKQVEKSS